MSTEVIVGLVVFLLLLIAIGLWEIFGSDDADDKPAWLNNGEEGRRGWGEDE